MSKPVLNATFQPQQWINDYAVNSSPAIDFDAGLTLLSLNARQLRHIVEEAHRSSGRDLDMLAEAAGLVGDGEDQHNGPFYVDIDPKDVTEFLEEVGITDLAALTDDDMVHIREEFAARPSGPTLG